MTSGLYSGARAARRGMRRFCLAGAAVVCVALGVAACGGKANEVAFGAMSAAPAPRALTPEIASLDRSRLRADLHVEFAESPAGVAEWERRCAEGGSRYAVWGATAIFTVSGTFGDTEVRDLPVLTLSDAVLPADGVGGGGRVCEYVAQKKVFENVHQLTDGDALRVDFARYVKNAERFDSSIVDTAFGILNAASGPGPVLALTATVDALAGAGVDASAQGGFQSTRKFTREFSSAPTAEDRGRVYTMPVTLASDDAEPPITIGSLRVYVDYAPYQVPAQTIEDARRALAETAYLKAFPVDRVENARRMAIANRSHVEDFDRILASADGALAEFLGSARDRTAFALLLSLPREEQFRSARAYPDYYCRRVNFYETVFNGLKSDFDRCYCDEVCDFAAPRGVVRMPAARDAAFFHQTIAMRRIVDDVIGGLQRRGQADRAAQIQRVLAPTVEIRSEVAPPSIFGARADADRFQSVTLAGAEVAQALSRFEVSEQGVGCFVSGKAVYLRTGDPTIDPNVGYLHVDTDAIDLSPLVLKLSFERRYDLGDKVRVTRIETDSFSPGFCDYFDFQSQCVVSSVRERCRSR